MYDRDLDADVDPAEIADMVSAHPAIARAMVNLHRRYRITTAQLAEATEDQFNLNTGGSGSGSITMPHEEVRDYFYQRQNYLDELDTAAEDLTARDADAPRRPGHRIVPAGSPRHTGCASSGASTSATRCCTAIINRRHWRSPPTCQPGQRDLQDGGRAGISRSRRPDRHAGGRRQVHQRRVPTTGPPGIRQLFRRGHGVAVPSSSTTSARTSATTSSGLSAFYQVSYETICHRLSTMQRPSVRGVPFSFVRVDRAGNMSKRQSATGLSTFSSAGREPAPLWNVYETFAHPGKDLGADRADARRAQLHVGGTYGRAARAPVRPARQDLRDRAGLRSAPCQSAGVRPRTGPVLGQRHPDRFGLPGLRAGQLPAAGLPRRSAGPSTSTSTEARCRPTW